MNESLAWEGGQTVKHEFVRGEVVAMAAGEDRDNIVALNLALALKPHLKGAPCQVFMADVKLRVEAADGFLYPDLMVTCSAADAADRLIKYEPLQLASVGLTIGAQDLWADLKQDLPAPATAAR